MMAARSTIWVEAVPGKGGPTAGRQGPGSASGREDGSGARTKWPRRVNGMWFETSSSSDFISSPNPVMSEPKTDSRRSALSLLRLQHLISRDLQALEFLRWALEGNAFASYEDTVVRIKWRNGKPEKWSTTPDRPLPCKHLIPILEALPLLF